MKYTQKLTLTVVPNRSVLLSAFILIPLTFAVDITIKSVDAFESSTVYSDRVLIDEMVEIKEYIKNINTNLHDNNLTAINLESERILDSTELKNISAQLQYRGDQKLANEFKNTIAKIAVSAESDTNLLKENIRNLSSGYNSIINVLSVAEIDYEKLLTSIGLSIAIFAVVLIIIPRIKRHYKIRS